MAGMTRWWREELDEDTLRCYFGTSEESVPPGYMSRSATVLIGNLGPDLPFVLDYRDSPVAPGVALLGDDDGWQRVSESVCELMRALEPGGPPCRVCGPPAAT
ncbi:hypothetical protein [Streptomyces liangshanensis]|uniref:hypothetical protein n=1 Tax=Streptomyces liangshanensis TaxID=2717324 RepID=UPI0036DD5FCE